jgi:ankyrin repeat protein
MTSIAPMPIVAPGSADIGRPGQQLLPGYVVKLLKTLKIPFGTDRSMSGLDVDPTVSLISHIFECIGALRDVNKVYRAKGSMVSRSVGTRVLFGMTAELGNILLDAITFDPPPDLLDATVYYSQVASSILAVFPEIAAQVTPSTGKVLLHHTALRASSAMAMEALKMVLKAFPAGAWTPDRTGALPLHWMTHNPNCTQEMINFLIHANPKSPWIADVDGYLPLHWAVNQDEPNVDVVAALLNANPSAAARACNKGSLPVHWAVNRDNIHVGVLRALVSVHADGVRTFDKASWLPIHQCCNRGHINLEALALLIELYPQGLQCPNGNGQLPLHRALDQPEPHVEAVQMLLQAFPGAAKVGDDEQYLPLHLALDCAQPNPQLSAMLLEQYPEAAFQKSRDGLLPLHCLISALVPSLEIAQMLIRVHPGGVEAMATDLVPADPDAEPDSWTGEWMERRWTPLSRAIDRGLDAFVLLFRDAQNAANAHPQAAAAAAHEGAPRGTGNQVSRGHVPQSSPPLHYTQTNSALGGPAPVEAFERPATAPTNEGDLLMQTMSSPNGGPLLSARAPGGAVAMLKTKDKDAHRRERGSSRGGDRDRDRDRGGDRDRDRERDRSSSRRHHRSSDRDRDRSASRSRHHRDRGDYSEDEDRHHRHRSDRDRDRDHDRDRDRERRHHSRRDRQYRDQPDDIAEEDDLDAEALAYDDAPRQEALSSSGPVRRPPPPSSGAPPRSLLEAAAQKPFVSGKAPKGGPGPAGGAQSYQSQLKNSRDLLHDTTGGGADSSVHIDLQGHFDPSLPSNLDEIV